MPCTYIETPEEISQRKKEANRKITQPYIEKLNKLTRLLCWVDENFGDWIVDNSVISKELTEFVEWSKQHRKDDEEKKGCCSR